MILETKSVENNNFHARNQDINFLFLYIQNIK